FAAAVGYEDAADREAFVNRHCAGDPALRERLRALLDAHDRANTALDRPDGDLLPADEDRTTDHPKNPRPEVEGAFPAEDGNRPSGGSEGEGSVIAGRYRLLQRIGEGGMGTVWMADQTEPVKRRVAVKLIRVDRGRSKTILARFEAERQAIALMDYPNI